MSSTGYDLVRCGYEFPKNENEPDRHFRGRYLVTTSLGCQKKTYVIDDEGVLSELKEYTNGMSEKIPTGLSTSAVLQPYMGNSKLPAYPKCRVVFKEGKVISYEYIERL